jgi:two-component sensor histidine kinase
MKPVHDDDIEIPEPWGTLRILTPEPVHLDNETNHRIANSLQILSTILFLQARDVSDGPARNILAATQKRIAAIAYIHRHLYQARDGQVVDIADYLDELARGLDDAFGPDSSQPRVEAAIEPAKVPMDVATSLGLLTTELVMNACKHAYAPDQPGLVRIDLYQTDNGLSRLEVRDFGIGRRVLPKPPHEGLGSQIIDAMARKLEARYAYVAGNPGTRFVLEGNFVPVISAAPMRS